MKLEARDPLFHRSIFFVELAVLLAIALCSGMLLVSLNDIDNLLLQTYQTTGAQRIRSVFQNMGERVENLRESLLASPAFNGLDKGNADADEIKAVQDLLKEDGNALNFVLLEGGRIAIGPDAVGPELEREIERRFGLTAGDLATYAGDVAGKEFVTRNFVQDSTGRMGIVVTAPLNEGSALMRVHFYEPPTKSAAAHYLEEPNVYYVDSNGLVATGAGGPFDNFDFTLLNEMPQTFFTEIDGARYVCTWGVLDDSDMCCVLFYRDPQSGAIAIRRIGLVIEVAAIGLVMAAMVFLVGRRWFAPVRSLERESGAYKIELEEKNELLRQDRLLRMMHGEGAVGLELFGGHIGIPGNAFVVLAVVEDSGRFGEGTEPGAFARSFFQDRGALALPTRYGGCTFALVQFSAGQAKRVEELLREFQSGLLGRFGDIERPCICASSVHEGEREVHLAYLEALEAMQYRASIDRAEEVILYGSLEVQIAQDETRRRLDEVEGQAVDAVRELRLDDAAAYCKELGTFEKPGDDPFSFTQYRFTSLKGHLAVALYECDTVELDRPILQDWAQAIVGSEGLLELVNVLQSQATRLKALRAACPIEERRFREMLRLVDEEYADPQFSATRLSRCSGVSLSTVTRMFRKYKGCTFLDYLHGLRIERAKTLLASTSMTLTEISQQVGYGNVMTMIRAFKRYENTTPGKYREDFENAQTPS